VWDAGKLWVVPLSVGGYPFLWGGAGSVVRDPVVGLVAAVRISFAGFC